jgi:RNA polymerase sigma-70 factor, ECF subfamily
MTTIAGQTDEQLMGLLCEGRDEALAELVRRYQNDLFRFCLHYLRNTETALEKAQETYLRIYAARARFDTGRAFKPWMLCIARNLCLNELKRKKMVQMESLETYASNSRELSGELMQAASDGPSEWLLADERNRAVMDVLAQLADEAREIVVMRYFEQMSARDIAEIVETTEGAVRTRLHRALNQLRDLCEARKEDF